MLVPIMHVYGKRNFYFVQLVNNNELFPASESLVSDIPAGDGKTANLFYSVPGLGRHSDPVITAITPPPPVLTPHASLKILTEIVQSDLPNKGSAVPNNVMNWSIFSK